MKKIKNKQAIKASQKAKAENLKKHIITVQNAEGEPDTEAEILIQNKISYTPKVSVIIPVYNTEEYLRECLDSVINQTLKEIEIICVDDGSTDSSLEILKEYSTKDNRIFIISRENKGVGYSRNEGIKIAKGEFIAFMDPDDYYPDLSVIENMYKAAIKHQVQICGGSLIVYDEHKKIEIKKTEENECVTENSLLLYQNFQYDYGFQRYIYKRDFIQTKNIYFPNYRRFQDPPFMIKAFAEAEKFYALKQYVYTYRCAYKTINWTEEKVYHLFCGLRDNLLISKKYNLETLFSKTLVRIKCEYKQILSSYDTERIQNIKKEIMSICLQSAENRYVKQQKQAKVSVILPIYNAAPYLRECLDSIINQTLKDIEIICVNDGSTDNSLDIIKEYAQKDIRIKYIDKPNAGYGQTMNCGMDLATGEYIGIVEPDDFIKPEMYETLYNKAKELDLDISKSNICVFYHKNKDKKYEIVQYLTDKAQYDTVQTPYHLQQYMMHWHCTTTAIYRTNFIKQNHITYNETPGAAYQDTSFWFKTHMLAKLMLITDKAFYMYRQGNEQQSTSNFTQGKYILFEYETIKKFIDDKHLNKFHSFYLFKKFKSCWWYYVSLPQCLKENFLKKLHDGFLNDIKNNNLDLKYFNLEQQKNLKAILNDNYLDLAKKNNSIIISLTSYPARINTVNQTIESLLNQTMKADKVILWLAPEQFPNKEKDLPQQLLDLQEKGLTIDWYHDIKSYKKLIPTLKKYPDAIIVTADDDIIYPLNWLQKLYTSYINEKKIIWCHRAHKIIMKNIFKISKYKNWKHCLNISEPSFYNFCTTGGGVLYPPNSFYKDVLDEEKFMKLAPLADDIWFWAMLVLNSKKINLVQQNMNGLNLIPRTQDTALWKINNDEGKNDIQLQNIIKKYPKIIKILRAEKYNKAYIFFPYNLCQNIYLKKLLKKQIQKQLKPCRIDIKNFGAENNAVDVITTAKVNKPSWLANAQGQGAVVETNQNILKLTIKAIQNGKLRLEFKGMDKRANGVRFPLWVDYKSIKINGKEILSSPITTWHDKPFRYEMPVKDGQIVTVEVIQKYHQYSKTELKEVILKLNPASDYIKSHIKKVTKKIYRKITNKSGFLNKIKRLKNKFSFAHKTSPVLDLIRQNQATLQQLQTQNNELKKEIEVLKKLIQSK